MYLEEMLNYVEFCKKRQPQAQVNLREYFQQVILHPYDQETLLQAFLFFEIKSYFPVCTELLLFEESPDCLGHTDQGKHDFVYLTKQNSIFLIETKFINTNLTGNTAKKKRNKQRNCVYKQVDKLRTKLNERWQIPKEQIHCGVFTTDPNLIRNQEVITKSVTISELKQWRIKIMNQLLTNKLEDAEFKELQASSQVIDRRVNNLFWQYYRCDICFHDDVCQQIGMCYCNV